MLFSNFWELIKSLVGNNYQLPKISTVLHEVTNLMQQHLISKANDHQIGSRRIQSLYHHPFLGLDLPQQLKMEMTGSSDDYIVRANGIRRRGMSSPWWLPLHLLRQSWGPNRLLFTAVRQSRLILKQLRDTDLKINADKFDILRTLPEYLEVLTSNRSQSNKA